VDTVFLFDGDDDNNNDDDNTIDVHAAPPTIM